MKNQELDDMLRRSLNTSSKVPDHIWDKIDHALSEQEAVKQATIIPFWNINKKAFLAAAAVVLLIATAGSFYLLDKETLLNTNTNKIATSNNNINTNTNSSNPPINNLNKIDIQNGVVNSNPTQIVSTQIQTNNKYQFQSLTTLDKGTDDHLDVNQLANGTIAKGNSLSELTVIELLPTDIDGKQGIAIAKMRNDLYPMVVRAEGKSSHSNSIGLQDRNLEREWLNDLSYPDHTIKYKNQRTNKSQNQDVLLGVTGGYNYGTLNNGGSIALNTRKQINNKIFIDGSVGIVMNNSSNEQNNFKGDFMSFKKDFAQRFSTNSMENLYSQTDPFYFIQVNPSIGINVSKNLDVSIGPDYQQMVSNYSHDVINLSDQSKVFPKYDFGVTGKVEVNLSKNIKAGFLAREGLSSIIMNNSNISDRRYFQVQLKYQLPYKTH